MTGCSVYDLHTLASAAVSKNPSKVIKGFIKQKSEYYATHPHALIKDVKIFLKKFNLELKNFQKAISLWKNPSKPGTKTIVKYSQHYKARAFINFEKGYVRVETISKDFIRALEIALVNTMLMPQDPRSVDLFSDKIELNGEPFLAGEIYDFENRPVLYKWRAKRYAKWLIKHRLKKYIVQNQTVYYVTFDLSKNSETVRVKKYLPYVKEFSSKYSVSKVLILAVIKTESDFNPYAVSYVPAFGLMQIVPVTAGVEGFERAYGYKKIPDRDFLFVPKNNINIGSAYLNLIFYKYLKKIKNPINREYCAICAYNSGIGNVLKVFSSRRDRAYYVINNLTPAEVYKRLTLRLPTKEGRNYLPKVLKHKKLFIGIK